MNQRIVRTEIVFTSFLSKCLLHVVWNNWVFIHPWTILLYIPLKKRTDYVVIANDNFCMHCYNWQTIFALLLLTIFVGIEYVTKKYVQNANVTKYQKQRK